ncbi:SDR family NAD(P)-dependent oxidoreductase [Photobacterium swingsii]|uniref:SDR family NAD(P)-dependent oxidoreductase n=1 Tax=Photobacterium swingsii TaxID=680026 RepID=UPI0040680051
MHILIIGGSGGIGSALIAHFRTLYPAATLYATYRTAIPTTFKHKSSQSLDTKLHWLALDVTSETEIKNLAEQLPQLNAIINTVGILYDDAHTPEKTVNECDLTFFQKNIQTNVTPSICIAKYFSRHLKASTPTFFIALSARIGSISDNNLGGWISYRTSKAALNMAMKTISIEWRYKLPHCCVVVFHPGTTDTSFSKPFQRNVPRDQLQTPQFVAQSLVHLLTKLTPKDSGNFYSYDGSNIPW